MKIGVLALQGDFEAHGKAVRGLGGDVVEVRRVAELQELDGLILPGGESTTLLNLMGDEPWFESLRSFHARGGTIFGTCAGAILLAREVTHPEQPSVGLLDVTVQRNAYGRQLDSFETEIEVKGFSGTHPAVFIRAPRFTRVGEGVEVLARAGDDPVFVRQGSLLAATFHPELTAGPVIHRLFLRTLQERDHRRAAC